MLPDSAALFKMIDAHKASLLNAQKGQIRSEEYKKAAEEATKKAAEADTAAKELRDVASSSGVLLIDALRAYSEGIEPPAEPPAEMAHQPKPPSPAAQPAGSFVPSEY